MHSSKRDARMIVCVLHSGSGRGLVCSGCSLNEVIMTIERPQADHMEAFNFDCACGAPLHLKFPAHPDPLRQEWVATHLEHCSLHCGA